MIRLGIFFCLTGIVVAGVIGTAQSAPPGVDFSGGWVLKDPVTSMPDLSPEGVKEWQENKAKLVAATLHAKAPAQPTAEEAAGLCFPIGFPRVMTASTAPLYIVQSPVDMLIDYASGGPPRFIWIGLPHDDSYWPTYLGESVATWDGDTLVIDTIKFVHDTFMGAQGLPHSDAMHAIERMRLTQNGKVMEDQIRIEDPKILRAPWVVTVHYQRLPDYRPGQHACQMD